ncbi:iron-containing alcohol dehydrogenase [uncultured Ramlibacter sp.]|uniref:iron-containing alcohol dehydrogenase n=1 Tax=uncultured Ramlibacter sp. TaxID=260755 RepID=UPI0026061B90|nr:iron-containing alcohol dehydrogenase [uncultured Ramlibacter sp.]
MSTAFQWHMPVAVDAGPGSLERIAAALDQRRAVVLAFTPARALGIHTRLATALGERLALWLDCDDSISSLARARELAAAAWPALAAPDAPVLLAIGGGTTLDLAKLLRCRPQDGNFNALQAAVRGEQAWPLLQLADLWLVPTTAGTGSEVTRWATVWDTEAALPCKRSLDEPFGWAQRAFVDPALTHSCPSAVSRDSAVDALAHALEAMWNRHANPVSDNLAFSAARRILRHLPRSLRDPGDAALRAEISQAALEAGLAFSQTRTALAHALSYALTLDQGIPHGMACAIWLPSAWELAVGHDPRLDGLLGGLFGGDPAQGAQQLKEWLGSIGIDARPQAHGITDAPERIHDALTSARGRNFLVAA